MLQWFPSTRRDTSSTPTACSGSAPWDYLFDDGALDRVHQCLLCYKNADGGWGHGLEHDIKSPRSNPLMLEFLLSIGRDTGLPLSGVSTARRSGWRACRAKTARWNPTRLLDYPHAPWWAEGGQTMPDSITGNLTELGLCRPRYRNAPGNGCEEPGLDHIRANEWLFMAYHAFDYYMNVDDFPDLDTFRAATLENIYACALAHERKRRAAQAVRHLPVRAGPDSLVAQHAPDRPHRPHPRPPAGHAARGRRLGRRARPRLLAALLLHRRAVGAAALRPAGLGRMALGSPG